MSFYTSKDQLNRTIDKYSDLISDKNIDYPVNGRYIKFKYSDMLNNLSINGDQISDEEIIRIIKSCLDTLPNPDSPLNMYNVHPNIVIESAVANMLVSLYGNPNLCMDIPSGGFLAMERSVCDFLAKLAWGREHSQSHGVFTFGGKGTLMYALKQSISKVCPNARKKGIKNNLYIITNDQGHPSHIEICNWLGIGEDNCIRLKTTNSKVSPLEIELEFDKIVNRGGILVSVIVNSMTTNSHAFDDIDEVRKAIDRVVKRNNLNYRPLIHADSVLGWVYLLISKYDFAGNPLGIDKKILLDIYTKSQYALKLKYADSFSADFHKTGFCGYSSSVFITKDKNNLFNIEGKYIENFDNLYFSDYSPYSFTMESSRPVSGVLSAWISLNSLGVNGFTQILANQTEAYQFIKEELENDERIVVCNKDSCANVIFAFILPNSYIEKNILSLTKQDIETIKNYNTGFYNFVINKIRYQEESLFFSISRTYKYMGLSLACMKLYSFSSNLDIKSARKIVKTLKKLLTEYNGISLTNNNIHEYIKSFDYDKVKDIL